MKRRSFLKFLGVSACTAVGVKTVVDSPDMKVLSSSNPFIEGYRTVEEQNRLYAISRARGGGKTLLQQKLLERQIHKMNMNSFYGYGNHKMKVFHDYGVVQVKLS